MVISVSFPIILLWGCDVDGFSVVSSRPKQHSQQVNLSSLRSSHAAILFQQYQKTDMFLHITSNDNNNNDSTNHSRNSVHKEISTLSSGVAVGVWMPQVRRIMAGIACLGVLETSYLTYTKFFTASHLPAFCGSDESTVFGSSSSSACESVLTGPYSTIPFTDIPLPVLGVIAYVLVVYLSLSPLSRQRASASGSPDDDTFPLQEQHPPLLDEDDKQNRILLTSLTTVMGTFSVFLMVILFGVLHQTCPYCIFSAACSITLAQIAWIGGCLPSQQTSNTKSSSSSSSSSMTLPTSLLAGIIAAVMLYFGANPSDNTLFASSSSWETMTTATTSTTLATTSTTTTTTAGQSKLYSPPDITTSSSQRALKVSQSLQSLHAKMYGAYWCSHCYDQKQILGSPAFDRYVEYVECSKDGMNSQSKLCKAKDIPGYPTWEIQNKLYPGQQELEELEELVEELLKVQIK
jgi:uncharacterized membrane protein